MKLLPEHPAGREEQGPLTKAYDESKCFDSAAGSKKHTGKPSLPSWHVAEFVTITMGANPLSSIRLSTFILVWKAFP